MSFSSGLMNVRAAKKLRSPRDIRRSKSMQLVYVLERKRDMHGWEFEHVGMQWHDHYISIDRVEIDPSPLNWSASRLYNAYLVLKK